MKLGKQKKRNKTQAEGAFDMEPVFSEVPGIEQEEEKEKEGRFSSFLTIIFLVILGVLLGYLISTFCVDLITKNMLDIGGI